MASFFDTNNDVELGGALSVVGAVVAGSVRVSGNKGAGSVAVAGGVLAIPVTHRVVQKTTGGAEALTLANGTPGQKLTIILVADDGDGTLTPATKTGWATCVFADAKDTLHLEYLDDTLGWIVTGYNGTAAPPVLT